MEAFHGKFYEQSPVEAIGIMEIVLLFSSLDGFDIRNIFIQSSYLAHCKFLGQ